MFGVALGTVLLILLALASSRQFSLEFLEGTQHLRLPIPSSIGFGRISRMLGTNGFGPFGFWYSQSS